MIHTDGSAHATVHLFMAVTPALADVTLDGAWVENIGVSAGATLFHTLPRAVSTNFTVGYFLFIEVGDLDNDGDLGTDLGPANWNGYQPSVECTACCIIAASASVALRLVITTSWW